MSLAKRKSTTGRKPREVRAELANPESKKGDITDISDSAPAAGVAPATKLKKPKKQKLVRDSFKMPKSEYGQIAKLKARCRGAGLVVKRSELLRAGLNVLTQFGDSELLAAVQVLKSGIAREPRSKKSKKLRQSEQKSPKSKDTKDQ